MNPVVRVIGVDPSWSKPMAWAFVGLATCKDKPALIDYGSGNVKDFDEFLDRWRNVDCVAVEDQFFKANYDTAKKLSWSAGKIMAVSEMKDVRSTTVNVATWKSQMLGKRIPVTNGCRIKSDYPITPIDRCKQLLKVFEGTDDEACAVLIAYYQCLKERGN